MTDPRKRYVVRHKLSGHWVTEISEKIVGVNATARRDARIFQGGPAVDAVLELAGGFEAMEV